MFGILTPGLVNDAIEMVRPHIAATLKSHAKSEYRDVLENHRNKNRQLISVLTKI